MPHNPYIDAFLIDVLGPLGAQVVARIDAIDPILGAYIPARTAIGWVSQGRVGTIPGGVTIDIKKSETGYDGMVGDFSFVQGTLPEVAGAVAVYLGVQINQIPSSVDAARLAKTIDLLVKAKDKQESGTGLRAAPIAPQEPIAQTPVAPKPEKIKIPKTSHKKPLEKPKAPETATPQKTSRLPKIGLPRRIAPKKATDDKQR